MSPNIIVKAPEPAGTRQLPSYQCRAVQPWLPAPSSSVTSMRGYDVCLGRLPQCHPQGCELASYKFARAKSILALAEFGTTAASLVDLAVPFSREVCEHLGR